MPAMQSGRTLLQRTRRYAPRHADIVTRGGRRARRQADVNLNNEINENVMVNHHHQRIQYR